jgi:hypothetical protein
MKSSVSKVTGYVLNDQSSNPGREATMSRSGLAIAEPLKWILEVKWPKVKLEFPFKFVLRRRILGLKLRAPRMLSGFVVK